MPILDAGFSQQGGQPDRQLLVNYGPTVEVTVGHYAPVAEQPRPTKAVFAQHSGERPVADLLPLA